MSGDTEALPEAVRRVEIAALSRTLPFRVVRTATIARTAEEAAEAVSVEVGQIVKSLVFRTVETDRAVLLLVSGANRVDVKKLASVLGEAVERPNADFVRERTGFAIGGVAPLGSTQPIAVYMDETLLGYDVVWAAAGTPFHVFETVPESLRIATDAEVVSLS